MITAPLLLLLAVVHAGASDTSPPSRSDASTPTNSASSPLGDEAFELSTDLEFRLWRAYVDEMQRADRAEGALAETRADLAAAQAKLEARTTAAVTAAVLPAIPPPAPSDGINPLVAVLIGAGALVLGGAVGIAAGVALVR